MINFYSSGFDISEHGGYLGFFGLGGKYETLSNGEYNGSTYITNEDGSVIGPQVNNIYYVNSGSGNSDCNILPLKSIPNVQASLQIRFTNDDDVRVYNPKLYAYDGVDLTVDPFGTTVYAAELIHTNMAEIDTGEGSDEWEEIDADTPINLHRSPGVGGIYAQSNTNLAASQHDWYVALSVLVSEIGSSTRTGLYFYMEYI